MTDEYVANITDKDLLRAKLLEVIENLKTKTQEYDELDELSAGIEEELTENLKEQTEQAQKLEKKLTQTLEKLARTEADKKRIQQELAETEREAEQEMEDLKKQLEKTVPYTKKIVNIEIENESLENEVRRYGSIIDDLQYKFDTQLEEIELLQNELEEQVTNSEEQIERLKQQTSELTSDIIAKDAQIRQLRLQNIYESPKQNKTVKNEQLNSIDELMLDDDAGSDKRRHTGGSFVSSKRDDVNIPDFSAQRDRAHSSVFNVRGNYMSRRSRDVERISEQSSESGRPKSTLAGLLTCSEIELERASLFQNGKNIMSILESTIACIDNRMSQKKQQTGMRFGRANTYQTSANLGVTART